MAAGGAALFAAGVQRREIPQTLRICADPNNLPFSNDKLEGFENRIAAVLAKEVHAQIEYVWWAQRKNFIDSTLKKGRCEIVMGLPAGYPGVFTTEPYYESSYVFVYRPNPALRLRTLYDDALARMRIGVHVVDANLAPPASILARRGLVSNVRGYSLFGAYGKARPASEIIEAVARGELDVAIVWGPMGGYFGSERGLAVSPIVEREDPAMPLEFGISIGVAPGNPGLRGALQRALDRNRSEIRRILDAYGVPQVRGRAT